MLRRFILALALLVGAAAAASAGPLGSSSNATIGAGTAIIGKIGIDQTTPGSTNGVNIAPSNGSGIAITPTVSSAAGSNLVVCSAACNLWSAYATTGATGGYFMSFNATSLPSNGAVTPIDCVQAPANTTQSLSLGSGPPDRYSTGVTLGFSTTGCFTLTASATAFFKARASQ